MILFNPEHVPMILSGRKTQTRRLGKRRWNIGSVHQCKTRLFGGEPFAHVRVIDVFEQPLRAMSRREVYAEGYDRYVDYIDAIARINHIDPHDLSIDEPVWVVEFEVVSPDGGQG